MEDLTSTYDLKTLAANWSWLIDLDFFQLVKISPFGDLFMLDQTQACCLLDINLGALEYATAEGSDPCELFPIAFDGRIESSYVAAGLHLLPGTCYGYKVQCVAGGSIGPRNVYVATLSEYIAFMGSFHEQIRDVADGDSVAIKVVRPPVN